MQNITELRNQLVDVFVGVRDGTIDIKIASELNNSAGKIINTTRAQLEYKKARKETPNIEFLNDDTPKKK